MRDEIEKFRQAGGILREIMERSRKLIRIGASYLEVADKIEADIKRMGAKPAFPVNISVNDIAAHYTPSFDDASVFKEGDLVKMDMGVHVDGYPADSAFTVSLGSNNDLVEAAESALDKAISLCTPGRNVAEIGAEVEKLIKARGYLPVSNLTGHSMERWNLHSGISIPNIRILTGPVLKPGQVVAVEPFATNGGGKVVEAAGSQIFRLVSERVRLPAGRKVVDYIRENFGTLPFASRWLPEEYRKMISYLVSQKSLHQYPILREINNGLISQAEHTVLVKQKPEVLT